MSKKSTINNALSCSTNGMPMKSSTSCGSSQFAAARNGFARGFSGGNLAGCVEGPTGMQGAPGANGPTGPIGDTGTKGEDGNFGGVSFDYTFDDTHTTTPTSGRLALNAVGTPSYQRNATVLYISNTDDGSNSIQNFLETVGASTSAVKGFVRISERYDISKFLVFQITALTIDVTTSYWTLDVSNQSYSASSPFDNNDHDIVVSFVVSGNKGDDGPIGPTGASASFPDGSSYSDYIFWNDAGSSWEIGSGNVHIGTDARKNASGSSSVAIGNQAGYSQATNGVAIGLNAGYSQANNAVAIGTVAGLTSQATNAVAIGNNAGTANQAADAVAIGTVAGTANQAANAVAIGNNAGKTSQSASAVAIGNSAGKTSQSSSAVAIGKYAGNSSQGASAIAIGFAAGNSSQQSNTVAIGTNAGNSNQFANSIILNASGVALNNTAASTFTVKPVREVTGTSVPTGFKQLYYNETSGEIVFFTYTAP